MPLQNRGKTRIEGRELVKKPGENRHYQCFLGSLSFLCATLYPKSWGTCPLLFLSRMPLRGEHYPFSNSKRAYPLAKGKGNYKEMAIYRWVDFELLRYLYKIKW